MRKFYMLIALLLTGLAGSAQCTDLFFSEYIEGSSSNKAIEIYNPTQNPIDLTNYEILRFNNGASASPSGTFVPVGMLAPGDVYVIGNPSANAGIMAASDTLHSITFFNGDDALVLMNNLTGDSLDIIGIVGIDPGTNWTVGSGATSEFTLVRMSSVQEGTTDWALSQTQWNVIPRDTTDSLGMHTMMPCAVTPGCSDDIFFSEYIEGSSSNKALEIYNPMDTVVDLTNYVIFRYNNGSLTATDSLFPQGMLDPDSVFVITNPSANAAIAAESDTTHTMTFFNGDDAILLYNMSTGDSLDIIGVIGIDPGSGWTVGTGATNNFTLVRMATVQQGELDWNIGSTQWDVFPIDMSDSLGAHTMNPCTAVTPLTVSFAGSGLTVNEAVGTASFNVTLSATPTSTITVDVVEVSGTANNGLDFTFTSPLTLTWLAGDSTPRVITVPVIDDALVEGTESIDFELQSASAPAMIGLGNFTLLIDDNDIPTYPIGDINNVDPMGVADSLNVDCRIVGVVHGVNLRPSGLEFTLIDSTGGIGVFSFTATSGYIVNEGDQIGIIGSIGQFRGLTQMNPDSIEFISAGNPLMVPPTVTSLGENTESQLVKLECWWLVDTAQWGGGSSGFNVDVTNGIDTLVVRIDADVDLFTAPVPTGNLYITGIGGQFDNSSPYLEGYQLLPRYMADIVSVPAPVAGFTFTQGAGFVVNFTDASTNATSWMWDFGDGNTSSMQSPSHTYGTNGAYTVTLIAENDCEVDTFTTIINVITGIDAGELSNVSVYPNPTEGRVNVDLSGVMGENVQLVATDITGKIVFQKDIVQVVQQFESFELSGQANGLYFIKVASAKGNYVTKIVVNK